VLSTYINNASPLLYRCEKYLLNLKVVGKSKEVGPRRVKIEPIKWLELSFEKIFSDKIFSALKIGIYNGLWR
jgi:hypothetical protein